MQVNPDVSSREEFSKSPPSILPKYFNAETFDFIDIDPQEIARQLCILEFQLFKQMSPKEFLNQKWNKPDKEINAPNVVAVIKQFNRMSFWVTSSIVKVSNIKNRTALLRRFIDIADVTQSDF